MALSTLYLLYKPATKENDRASMISKAIQTNYRCAISDYIKYGSSRACLINKHIDTEYDIALIGNSLTSFNVNCVKSSFFADVEL